MISRKCITLFTCSTKFLQYIIVITAVNLTKDSLCQANLRRGSRYTREANVVPHHMQADDPNLGAMKTRDPCESFTNFDVEKRTFYSPGYPAETYPNNTDCVLTLEAPSGKLITLDFRDWFRMEYSPDCKNDYLDVRDGRHGFSNQKGLFCGFDFPPMITSSDRHLWIRFKSDENIEYRGFKAVFDFIDRPVTTPFVPEILPCEIELVDLEEGIFGRSTISNESKSFVEKYNTPIDCLWKIKVREKWRVQLQFMKFVLDKPNDCESNFVQVFSDKTYTDLIYLERTFCGSIADTILSKGNVMYVRFYSESKDAKVMFEANFTAFRDNEKDSPTFIPNCAEDELDCEDATCISNSLKCNKRYNCRFRFDEENCPDSNSMRLTNEHIIVIMVIFSLILSGMCFTFLFNCVKKFIRDHRTIQEYIRQSREQQLNVIEKTEPHHKSKSRSNSSPSLDSRHQFDTNHSLHPPCYVPGGELLPILIRTQHENSVAPSNGDAYNTNIYTVDQDNPMPEMCDSACQTRESLFNTQGYSSGNSTPNHSIHADSPPAPFSTFGYKKDHQNKFKAEAKIEMGFRKPSQEEKRRPYSVQTTKSAPDVIVTH